MSENAKNWLISSVIMVFVLAATLSSMYLKDAASKTTHFPGTSFSYNGKDFVVTKIDGDKVYACTKGLVVVFSPEQLARWSKPAHK